MAYFLLKHPIRNFNIIPLSSINCHDICNHIWLFYIFHQCRMTLPPILWSVVLQTCPLFYFFGTTFSPMVLHKCRVIDIYFRFFITLTFGEISWLGTSIWYNPHILILQPHEVLLHLSFKDVKYKSDIKNFECFIF